jgi:hypothetical protein
MIVMAIVGGTVLGVLWFSFGTFFQLDDYTAANEEIDLAVQKLSREFALIGLGMPNNRVGKGSFMSAFAYSSNSPSPIMFLMGKLGEDWGGPVTITNANSADKYDDTTLNGKDNWQSSSTNAALAPEGAFVGPELYYAWGVPTGIKGRFPRKVMNNDDTDPTVKIELSPLDGGVSGGEYLRDFQYDGRRIGLQHDDSKPRGRDLATWVLFPTLRVPLLLTSWGDNELMTKLAPTAQRLRGVFMGLDEIHLLQVARLYRNADNELVQVIFGSDYTTDSTNVSSVLARNVVGLQFTYNPASRLLTMYIATRGEERTSISSGEAKAWPSWLPPLPGDAAGRRLVVKSLSWRIRN